MLLLIFVIWGPKIPRTRRKNFYSIYLLLFLQSTTVRVDLIHSLPASGGIPKINTSTLTPAFDSSYTLCEWERRFSSTIPNIHALWIPCSLAVSFYSPPPHKKGQISECLTFWCSSCCWLSFTSCNPPRTPPPVQPPTLWTCLCCAPNGIFDDRPTERRRQKPWSFGVHGNLIKLPHVDCWVPASFPMMAPPH